MLRGRKAFVFLHRQGLLIGSCSGPGAAVQEDWAQPIVWLEDPSRVSKAVFGAAIRKAWSQCREIPMISYKETLAERSKALGISNTKEFFSNVKSVSPSLIGGIVSVEATKQTGVDEFKHLRGTEVQLSEHVSDEELGAAVLDALNASS